MKTDIWSHLDSSLIPKSSGTIAAPGIDGAENEGARKPEKRGRDDDLKATLTTGSSVSTGPAANATSELSFQELINDIAVEQKQKDVSLSFYFICLLHLANEKVRISYLHYLILNSSRVFNHFFLLLESGNCSH